MERMGKTIVALVLLIFVVGGGFFMLSSSGPVSNTAIGTAVIEGNVQKLTLSMKDYNYYPQKITVKVGIPVELTLDDSVKGCLRSFTIKSMGVSKYAQTPKDIISFTPSKAGEYSFACSMGMGFGTIQVI